MISANGNENPSSSANGNETPLLKMPKLVSAEALGRHEFDSCDIDEPRSFE